MTQPTKFFKQVSLDSTMELLADFFNAEAAGADLFTTGAFGDQMTISLGLSNVGVIQTVTQINNGFIDEWELTIDPKTQVTRVRGRDASAPALDRIFEKTYIFQEVTQGFGPPGLSQNTLAQIKAAQKTSILFPNGHLFAVGRFTARQIAQDLLSSVGLNLSWQVRDYNILSTFQARGRVAETLKRLIEPWVQVEPFRADMFLQGSTVIIRYRQTFSGGAPGAKSIPLTPTYVMSIAQMRRGMIRIRKRVTRTVGRLRLLGQLQNQNLTDVSVDNPNQNTETVIIQSSLANGVTTVTRSVYLLPQNLLKEQDKDVYSPITAASGSLTYPLALPTQPTGEGNQNLGINIEPFVGVPQSPSIPASLGVSVSVPASVGSSGAGATPGIQTLHEEIRNNYIDTPIGPLPDVQETKTSEFDQSVNGLLPAKWIIKRYVYDANFQTVSETTTTQTFLNGGWGFDSMNIKTYTDVAPGMTEIVTEDYAAPVPSSTGGTAGIPWTLVKRDSQIAAGHRAGGSGRGFFIPNGSQAQVPIELDFLLSTASFAVPVEYSNQNLSRADLQFLAAMFSAENSLNFEFEVSFSGVAMPWLQRGVIIQITGLTDPDGNAITLPPLLVTEVRTSYDESKASAQMISESRAFGWQ